MSKVGVRREANIPCGISKPPRWKRDTDLLAWLDSLELDAGISGLVNLLIFVRGIREQPDVVFSYRQMQNQRLVHWFFTF
jgi:hypothetical protein